MLAMSVFITTLWPDDGAPLPTRGEDKMCQLLAHFRPLPKIILDLVL